MVLLVTWLLPLFGPLLCLPRVCYQLLLAGVGVGVVFADSPVVCRKSDHLVTWALSKTQQVFARLFTVPCHLYAPSSCLAGAVEVGDVEGEIGGWCPSVSSMANHS